MRKSLSLITSFGLAIFLAHSAIAQPARNAAPLPVALSSFAADVGAVLGAGAEAKLLLNETDHGVTSTRTIGVGEDYRDGWKITAISQTQVALAKGADTRTIMLTGRSQLAAATPGPVAAPATVSASNSLVGGSPRAGGARSPALQAAITAGNVRQVLSMGGSPQDAIAALEAQGRLQLGANMDPASAMFVRMGESVGVSIATADGSRRQVISTSDFDGFTPPGPVETLTRPAPPVVVNASGQFVIGDNVVVRQSIVTNGAPSPPTPLPPAPPR